MSFSKLLNNPSNNITPMVQHLVLSTVEICRSITVLLLLPTITTHLPVVTSLSLAQIDLTQCPPEILQKTLSNLGNVEALELKHIAIDDIEEAAAFICAFPLLKSISVDHVFPKDNASTIIRRQRPSFLISFIDLCNFYGGIPIMLMAWLLKPMPTIHTIRCFPLVIAAEVAVPEIIASVGTSIREIEIILNIIVDFHGVLFVHFLQTTPLTLYSMVQDGRLLISRNVPSFSPSDFTVFIYTRTMMP